VHDHPDVRRAAAQVREAFGVLANADPGAISGFVARRHGAARAAGQPGERPDDDRAAARRLVDANFKENQLAHRVPGSR